MILYEANTYISKNGNGKVKFCFADSHGDLKIKFSDKKMLVLIHFSRSWRYWIRNLATVTVNVKVMNGSMSKNGFFKCLYRFRFIVFLVVILIKHISISTFLTNS